MRIISSVTPFVHLSESGGAVGWVKRSATPHPRASHHLPLSPSAYGERAEAGAAWPAEGEGQPLVPNPLLPLTLTLSPCRTGRGDTRLTLTLSPYKTGRGDIGPRP